MKTLKYMVFGGWIFIILLEIVLYFASQAQDLPIYRQDRMATVPILLFLTIYYVFRLRSDGTD